MSIGLKVPFVDAYRVAIELAKDLHPVVTRVKAAGSLRRQRPTVSDLEFVAEPRLVGDLFGGGKPDLEPIRRVVAEWGTVSKNGDRFIQIRHVLGTELTCDLFLVWPPAQWGSILAIRTGPAELGKAAVTRMRALGYVHVDGHVERADTREVVPTPTEEDFFRVAGLPCLPPKHRDTPLALKPTDAT